MAGLTLETKLSEIQGIAPRFLRNFAHLNIATVKDLLWHFPVRYEDFSEILPIAELEPGRYATIQGVIQNIKIRRSFRRRMVIVEALIADDSGTIKATWFNQPYLLTVLRPGRLANFSGKVTLNEDELRLSHPIHELVGKRETRHTARLVPIYPETRGLTSKGIRFLVQPILKHLEPVPEWLPEETLAAAGLPEINEALGEIHFPKTIGSALRAQKRFSFEELFLLQLLNGKQKMKLAREKAPLIKTDIEKLKEILKGLPFTLTPSQKKSLWEIIQDLEKSRPMNRLLQGDVGSGKTAVAALAALIASHNGIQTVFMAPTEILARQHFETLKKLFRGIAAADQPATALLTSTEAKIFYETDVEADIKKTALLKKIKEGEVNITIGTHALIQKNVEFKNLGFVAIDEQHRFGVRQRAKLLKNRTLIPHLLSMSATPIPRTLMLTIFGDLDISTITELPSGRKPIITKIVAPANRHKAYQFIREQIKKGRQAFVICPRISADTQTNADITQTHADGFPRSSASSPRMSAVLTEVKTVKEEYEKLSRKIFPDLRVAMLHGKMPARTIEIVRSGGPAEEKSRSGKKINFAEKNQTKEKIMREFETRNIDILVCTSIVEVGVDIPNATIMMIEGSERFGLAQLYQLRGRVGRGQHQSFCFLFTDLPAGRQGSDSTATRERLKAILEAKNGFELAEKDLKIRGPGEFIGQKQTGLPDIAMRGLQDIELIKQSRSAAIRLLQNDSGLKKHPLLIERFDEFQKKIHPE